MHDKFRRDTLQLHPSSNMASKDLTDQLKDLTLENVIPQNKELGRGAYGKVFSVDFLGLPCAAKEIHSLLLDGISPEEKKAIKDGFIRECYHSSLIRHPNIVQFMGVYYAKPSDPRTDLPIMVMELMDTSLTSFIENNQSKIATKTKLSILHDVSLGLSYLHCRRPAVIHRDLSSNNVLLSKGHLVVKISDLGTAKMIRAGADPGFWEGGSEHRGGSLKQGVWGAQPPRSYRVFPFYSTEIMPKCKI